MGEDRRRIFGSGLYLYFDDFALPVFAEYSERKSGDCCGNYYAGGKGKRSVQRLKLRQRFEEHKKNDGNTDKKEKDRDAYRLSASDEVFDILRDYNFHKCAFPVTINRILPWAGNYSPHLLLSRRSSS